MRRPDFPASGRKETASFPPGIFRGSERPSAAVPEAGRSQFRKERGPATSRFAYHPNSSAWSETSGREDPSADRRQNGKYPAASQAERRAGHQQTSWKGRPDGKKAEWSAGARAICSKSQGRAAGRRRRREWQPSASEADPVRSSGPAVSSVPHFVPVPDSN